jgi:GlcNAc-PI de-N-acetylase
MSGNDSSDDDLVMGRTNHAQDPTRLHANDDGHSWGDDVGLSAVGRNRLECIRRFELHRAAGILGVSEMTCLGLPDGELSDHEAWLADALTAILRQRRAGVWCAATWRGDGHLDHEAVGRAAVFAARRAGAVLLEYPIWMWHSFPTCPATATPRYPSASQRSATSTTCLTRPDPLGVSTCRRSGPSSSSHSRTIARSQRRRRTRNPLGVKVPNPCRRPGELWYRSRHRQT